jgi:uncharacterized protein
LAINKYTKMKEVVGRYEHKSLLDTAFKEHKASLITVYGRRRIGKTYLIKNYLSERITFQFSGIHNVTTEIQLEKFTTALATQFNNDIPLATPHSWFAAFDLLTSFLHKKRAKKLVIFLDELPWMHTPKSNFLAAFENFWNSYAADKPNMMVILCGSAASWMIKNIVRNKGGLHNRITHKMVIHPFSLYETEQFLKSRGVYLNHYQMIQLYMALGGIPLYLEQALPGLSTAQIIDTTCFTKQGFMYNEFIDLYQALFYKSDRHINIVKALATKPMGLSRNQIIKTCKLQTGGTATTLLEELSTGGFITAYIPFGKKAKDAIYKLTDEYSLFYLKFMEGNKQGGKGTWLQLSDTPSYKSWSGLAFETLCIKHIEPIKQALGIHTIYTTSSAWKSTKASTNAQIDLVIDRKDQTINLCEMKFYDDTFTIDKKYAAALRQKASIFKQETKTRKQLSYTLITTFGLHKNEHSIGLVDTTITASQLFIPYSF